jgi:hypothetical protein
MPSLIRLDKVERLFESTSMGSNIESSVINLTDMEGYCLHFIWSGGGSPVGNLYIQASNNGSDFVTVAGSELSVTGNSGQHMINVADFHYTYIKVKYDRTSGSATANALLTLRSRSH